MHVTHTFLRDGALARYTCSVPGCNVKGFRRIGIGWQRGAVVEPYTCAKELPGRVRCGADAVYVSAVKSQARCKEHAPGLTNKSLDNQSTRTTDNGNSL